MSTTGTQSCFYKAWLLVSYFVASAVSQKHPQDTLIKLYLGVNQSTFQAGKQSGRLPNIVFFLVCWKECFYLKSTLHQWANNSNLTKSHQFNHKNKPDIWFHLNPAPVPDAVTHLPFSRFSVVHADGTEGTSCPPSWQLLGTSNRGVTWGGDGMVLNNITSNLSNTEIRSLSSVSSSFLLFTDIVWGGISSSLKVLLIPFLWWNL